MTNEEREDLNTFRHDLIKRARWWQWKAETLEKEKEQLKAENAALRERLGKVVELPCKVGDSVLYVFINTVPDDDYYCSFHKEPCIRTVSFRLEYLYEWGKNYFPNTEEGMLAAKSRLAELKGSME